VGMRSCKRWASRSWLRRSVWMRGEEWLFRGGEVWHGGGI
jgi:hypothetical protein